MAKNENDHNPGVEPKSYGTNQGWLEGETAQTVERTPQRKSRHDEAFYRSELDADHEAATEGPAVTRMEEPHRTAEPAQVPVVGKGGKKVPESNETRQSYFRERDYD